VGASVTLCAPQLLNANHQLAGFDCGHPDLNNWLSKRALTNQGEGLEGILQNSFVDREL
jgi:hypothetical protein